MGKINKKASPSKKLPNNTDDNSKKPEKPAKSKNTKSASSTIPLKVTEDSSPKTLAHKKSLVIKKNRKTKGLKKKDKQQLKKKEMLKLIELTKKDFVEEKKRKIREKTAVVGDMRPLLDSLPSLDSLYTLQNSLKSRNAPNNKAITKRQKKLLRIQAKTEQNEDKCAQLTQLWNDPKFQKNPREVLAEKIRKRLQEEQQQMES